MGTFLHEITLFGLEGRETLRGMVDTGAHFTTVPASVLNRLGVHPFRRMGVQFASGEVEQWPVGQVEAEMLGTRMPIFVFFGPEDGIVLIGAHTLEAFPFAVDGVSMRLIPQDKVPMMDSHA